MVTPVARYRHRTSFRLLLGPSVAMGAAAWLLSGSAVSASGSETPAAGVATHSQERLITVVDGPGEKAKN